MSAKPVALAGAGLNTTSMDNVILHLDVLELIGVLMAAIAVVYCLVFAAIYKLVELAQRARRRGPR